MQRNLSSKEMRRRGSSPALALGVIGLALAACTAPGAQSNPAVPGPSPSLSQEATRPSQEPSAPTPSTHATNDVSGPTSSAPSTIPPETTSAEPSATPLAPPAPTVASPSTTTAATESIAVVITFAGRDGDAALVNAYVSGVVEDDGQCKATFTSASIEVTAFSDAFGDATTTWCSELRLAPVAKNESGSIVVEYQSSRHSGRAEVELEEP